MLRRWKVQGIELLCKGVSDQIVEARLNLSDRPEMKRRWGGGGRHSLVIFRDAMRHKQRGVKI